MKRSQKITRHVCPRNCYSSCSMLGYTVNGKLVKVSGDSKHGYTKGKLCPKGYNYLSHVYHPERLKFPMIQSRRGSGEWNRISWEEAIDHICHKMIELHDRYQSNLSLCLNKYSGNFGILHNSVEGFFNSLGQTTRAVGSPCWPSGLDASIYDFGDYKHSNPEQLTYADTIILWGSNPIWTSIHSVQYLYEAKSRGATIITIDPVYTASAKKSDVYIQIKPGTDGAFALVLAKFMYEQGVYDEDFITNHTKGFSSFREYSDTLDIDALLMECGLTIDAVSMIAKHMKPKRRTTVWIGFGLQRNKYGGQNIRAIHALMAITGNIGKKGCGVMYADLSNWEFSNRITQYYSHGFTEENAYRSVNINDFAHALQDTTDPPIKMLWITCRNLMTQNPDQRLLYKGLLNMELIVTIDQFLTPTAKLSDIVLPTTTNFEEWDIVPSYWHQWLGINEPAINPYYESKSDLEISCMLSKRLNELRPGFSTFPYDKQPEDFIDAEFTEKLYEQLGISNWRELLDGPKCLNVSDIAWQDYQFKTPSKKFEFYSEVALQNGKPPMAQYILANESTVNSQFLLITNHGQFNLNSQFVNLDLLNREEKEPIAFMHPSRARQEGITNHSYIQVYNKQGEITVKCILSTDVHPAALLVQAEHHIVNELVYYKPTDMGEISSTYEGMAFNSIYVSVKGIKK
ncbi:molybdopterin-dependent oxidoreductase [Bacillus massiliigorillae]|uniref:molybdopterin-dependent oxidoreductase n=1 Tax=Bacillus massiliigorillae TaxID=1243664 RepID=UPI0005AA9EE8|nr:molybdopterin-dependent oxidoreductase [Bacillus massiliigorillae]